MKDPKHFERVRALLETVLELPDGEVEPFLAQQDPELRAEVTDLLGRESQAVEILERVEEEISTGLLCCLEEGWFCGPDRVPSKPPVSVTKGSLPLPSQKPIAPVARSRSIPETVSIIGPPFFFGRANDPGDMLSD